MNRVYLLLGSNLGDRAAILSRACTKLSERLLPTISEGAANLRQCVNISGDLSVFADMSGVHGNEFVDKSVMQGVLSNEAAIKLLMPMFVMSDMIETEPVGFECDMKFINMAISVKTLLNVREVLKICQGIEIELGRDRGNEGERYNDNGERIYHSRLIDIDILFCEDFDSLSIEKVPAGEGNMGEERGLLGRFRCRPIEVNDSDLIVPHKELPNRPFAQYLLKQVIAREN
jgi:2-amino-4-hydroxy-6-hydroxymethyldihydropteridine diphosphokinase